MAEVRKPISPKVEFEVINNNMFNSSPLLGVTFIAAVTTKGTPNDPSTIIKTPGKFKELYGEEIVPDGSISNIEIALKMGSTIRVSKVAHTGETGQEATTSDAWIAAVNAFAEYDEAYQMICSGINQWFKGTAKSADLEKVHRAASTRAKTIQDLVYYIEVPKYKVTEEGNGTDPMDDEGMKTWTSTLVEKLTNSSYIAYFAGGWKYYDTNGDLQNCDTLGTVIGLGDASASNYGPWYSFAGQNRGLVRDARGIVSPNYGADANYEKLNEIAENYINISVIKDTRNLGKLPMLWHNFTSSADGNSFMFLGVVRCVLYLKKMLKPIMDSYLEEPNTFSTWNTMYYDVKPILDDMVTKNAITEYTWIGDQDATNYDELNVNNEADVRLGKYKAELHFKEVVAMQEIIISLVIDKSSGTTSAEVQTASLKSVSPKESEVEETE